MVELPIDDSVRFEEDLAILLNAEGGELPGNQSALWRSRQVVGHFEQAIEDVVSVLLAVALGCIRLEVTEPFGNYSGRGEDDPIWSTRLLRDGWVLEQPGKIKENKFGSRLWIQFIENTIWRKSYGEWADWSRSGEVLFARSGRLYRISLASKRATREPEELIDLRELEFEPMAGC